jgi:leucyl aminopeptidase
MKVASRPLSWNARHAVLGLRDAFYRFDQLKSQKKTTRPALAQVVLPLSPKAELQNALKEAGATADGVDLARTLGNLPGNICTPGYLAEEAKKLAREFKLDVDVLERKDMEKLGMGSFLSVARASHQPPKLIVLHYNNAKSKKPLALVGKGITFDTGGISLKPAGEMDEMKFDMSGAGSVLGTLRALAGMKAPVNVVGIIPACENMPGGAATKPGDVVTTLSGQTVEILNTDAEGRLILCDALSYAEQRFKPDAVIDIATLTGACVIALGNVATGLFANDQKLADEVRSAGDDAWDRVWQMPLWEDYQEQLRSNFADFANIGGRPGGAITAACFLARFTRKLRWAHLDIAGTAWKGGREKGSTGRPVPLLVRLALRQAGRK